MPPVYVRFPQQACYRVLWLPVPVCVPPVAAAPAVMDGCVQ
jgi:hypothetical protein